MKDPQEPDNSLISLENDPIYYKGITAEELAQTLKEYDQPDPVRTFFNNLSMHLIDPIYLEYDDCQFQKDIQEVKKTAETKYLKNYTSAEEALKTLTSEPNDEQILLLSHIYIDMRQKRYPRYNLCDNDEVCLVR